MDLSTRNEVARRKPPAFRDATRWRRGCKQPGWTVFHPWVTFWPLSWIQHVRHRFFIDRGQTVKGSWSSSLGPRHYSGVRYRWSSGYPLSWQIGKMHSSRTTGFPGGRGGAGRPEKAGRRDQHSDTVGLVATGHHPVLHALEPVVWTRAGGWSRSPTLTTSAPGTGVRRPPSAPPRQAPTSTCRPPTPPCSSTVRKLVGCPSIYIRCGSGHGG
jgi:hypothetical protein